MIVERYVTLETAKLLKEKGFDEKCMSYYGHGEFQLGHPEYMRSNTDRDGVACNGVPYDAYNAPTIQTAAEWLRVEKGFYVYAGLDIDYDEDENGVKYYHDPLYYGNIVRTNDGEQMYDGGEMYDQPEYAVEAMIRYCLENLI